jgi:hypothetical protein
MEENMNARLFAFPIIVLASVVLGAACTASAGGSVGVDVACQGDGAPCIGDLDCCDYACIGGACGAPVVAGCVLDNDACGADADCCSGFCAGDGLCGVPASVVSACLGDGSTCDYDEDCCSYDCTGNVCGGAVNGCILDNAGPCSADSDCCSGYCASDGNCGLP